MMVFPDDGETRYAVFNKERNIILKDAMSNSTYSTEEEAREILNGEWGGEPHLCIVKVEGL